MVLCQLVRVQALQGAALQHVTRCRAYCLFHCNISFTEVNELDTGCPQPAQQSYLVPRPLFSLHAIHLQPNISTAENSNFT